MVYVSAKAGSSNHDDPKTKFTEAFAKLEDVHKSNAAWSAVFSFFQIFGRLLSKMTKLFQKSATSGHNGASSGLKTVFV